MRTMPSVQGLFAVSAALFIGGIGFIIAGGRSAQHAPAAVYHAPIAPVASIKQIMNGIVMPNADVVYKAVGSTITAAGSVDVAPRNDQEWARVADSAAAIVESGNLLLMDGRAVDDGEWVRMTRTFIDAGKVALKAAEDKQSDGVFMAGGDLNGTCDVCHERYQRR